MDTISKRVELRKQVLEAENNRIMYLSDNRDLIEYAPAWEMHTRYKGSSTKGGSTHKTITKRRAKNKNKKTHRK